MLFLYFESSTKMVHCKCFWCQTSKLSPLTPLWNFLTSIHSIKPIHVLSFSLMQFFELSLAIFILGFQGKFFEVPHLVQGDVSPVALPTQLWEPLAAHLFWTLLEIACEVCLEKPQADFLIRLYSWRTVGSWNKNNGRSVYRLARRKSISQKVKLYVSLLSVYLSVSKLISEPLYF